MKCDLHVHSLHSGNMPWPVLRHFFQESHSAPIDVYQRLHQRGMDLVTLTDHDSIRGAEELRRFPDFFVSEEVSCRMPSGTLVHIGVYDLSERQHVQISRRRDDLIRLLAYLSEQRLFFTINHIFSSLTGSRVAGDFDWFADYFPAVEALNGQMLPEANWNAAEMARRLGKIQVGGSDAHALVSAGTAYTEVPGARDKEEFLAGLRAGYGHAHGESGGYWKLSRDILLLCREMMRKDLWTILLIPVVGLVPAAVAINYFLDLSFARHWGARINPAPFGPGWSHPPRQKRPAWEVQT
jgi:predicted metal-dependent phosphoesterase TrpH